MAKQNRCSWPIRSLKDTLQGEKGPDLVPFIEHVVLGKIFVCIPSFGKHVLINGTYNSNHPG